MTYPTINKIKQEIAKKKKVSVLGIGLNEHLPTSYEFCSNPSQNQEQKVYQKTKHSLSLSLSFPPLIEPISGFNQTPSAVLIESRISPYIRNPPPIPPPPSATSPFQKKTKNEKNEWWCPHRWGEHHHQSACCNKLFYSCEWGAYGRAVVLLFGVGEEPGGARDGV